MYPMTDQLSNWAYKFIREERIAVITSVEKDGSPHITGIWYCALDDGTIVMNTQVRSHKVKNLRRDPRIAVCVADGARSISMYGLAELITDPGEMRKDLERLVARYIPDAAARGPMLELFLQQGRVSIYVKPARVTEFTTLRSQG
jgi:PPOX class probable F420-dependent enzyme